VRVDEAASPEAAGGASAKAAVRTVEAASTGAVGGAPAGVAARAVEAASSEAAVEGAGVEAQDKQRLIRMSRRR
jgi:hypothetical protein